MTNCIPKSWAPGSSSSILLRGGCSVPLGGGEAGGFTMAELILSAIIILVWSHVFGVTRRMYLDGVGEQLPYVQRYHTCLLPDKALDLSR